MICDTSKKEIQCENKVKKDSRCIPEPTIYQPSSTVGLEKKQHLDIVQLLGKKFNLTFEQLSANEIFEEAIIKNAKSFEEPVAKQVQDEIPNSIVITGNASWIYNPSMFPLHEHLLIDYRSLSYEQRQLLVEAYNDHYKGLHACTLEQFECLLAETFDSYLTGHIRNGQYKLNNLICFPVRGFCELVLDDLKPFMHLPTTH